MIENIQDNYHFEDDGEEMEQQESVNSNKGGHGTVKVVSVHTGVYSRIFIGICNVML